MIDTIAPEFWYDIGVFVVTIDPRDQDKVCDLLNTPDPIGLIGSHRYYYRVRRSWRNGRPKLYKQQLIR